MGLPRMNIRYKERGISAIRRGERGIVALILEANTVPLLDNKFEMRLPTEIPESLSVENKEQIELAFKGYITPPRKVIVYLIKEKTLETPVEYTDAQNYLEANRFDYVAIPNIEDSKVDSIATWIKTLRDTKGRKVKAVLPNSTADHEGIINFTEHRIVTKDKEFTTKEYCGRIAGLIAGTPLTISCTFAPLPEVIECDNRSKEELDEAIDRGEFALYNDGEKVKVARAVNSFTTTIEGKGESYKKIKIIEALDMIDDDLTKEAEDSYLGKYSNSYDNKCLLIVAIKIYLRELERAGILNAGHTGVDIDIERQIEFLHRTAYTTPDGRTVDDMTELEIRKGDTKDKVFLTGQLKVLDAIEEIDFPIAI